MNTVTTSFLLFSIKISVFLLFVSFSTLAIDIEKLRALYDQPSEFWPPAEIDEGIHAKEIGLLEKISFPKENSFTEEKLRLGEQLFHDGRLSRSQQIACVSCHDSDLGWGDGRRTSFGHNLQKGKRNAPTIENVGYGKHFFWDGRAATLEQQALMPLQDPVEMNFTLPELEERLSQIPEYKKAFKAAFGDENITAKKIGQALATYQRTIVSRLSRFDLFLMATAKNVKSDEKKKNLKMSDQAILGMHLFRTKARCMNCHNGPTFSDQKLHNIGLTYYKRKYQDFGQYNVTKNPNDVGKFKTPSLRGVMNNKPWMHNGLFSNMRGLLNLYNGGVSRPKKDPNDPLSPVTSKLIKPLLLTKEEILALEEFLKAITAPPALGPSRKYIQLIDEN